MKVLRSLFVLAVAGVIVWLTILLAAVRADQTIAFAPEVFSAPNLRSVVVDRLSSGEGQLALQQARKLVALEPLRRGNLALLGSVELAAGDVRRSDMAFGAAAQLGWRDPASQYWAIVRSVEAGDAAIAADRLEALLRTHPTNPVTDEAVVFALDHEATKVEMLSRGAKPSAWRDNFLRRIGEGSESSDRARVAFISEICATACVFDKKLVTDVTSSVFARSPRDAQELWLVLAGRGDFEKNLIWDSRINPPNRFSAEVGPFQWRLLSDERWQTDFDTTDGGIVAVGSGFTPSRLAHTHVVVPFGEYNLSWQASVSQTSSPSLLIVPVCARPEMDLPKSVTSTQGSSHSLTFKLSSACEVLQLRVIAPRDGGKNRWLKLPQLIKMQ